MASGIWGNRVSERLLIGMGFSFGDNENVLELGSSDCFVSQHCESAKSQ
jgi:hypothetical protein